MSYRSCLDKSDAHLILDTSAFINLRASGEASRILQALPNRTFITKEASEELDNSKAKPGDRQTLEAERQAGRIQILELTSDEREQFAELISAPHRPLGDGEAATLVVAQKRGAIAVIDEKRARSMIEEKAVASSVDLFSHHLVIAEIGIQGQRAAVYSALRHARMSVRDDQRQWCVDLIGNERAAKCNSLPRHREFLRQIEENSISADLLRR
ncbi:hypothetical protein [Marinicauda sp. Alg238-R41]|uniref:hypothetical protein n=1 Tax=Marinicauda sp. Alg238-R41 TaxID=2993447 RepID=UPI0022E91283|nr:hypothetical protein [Marinicauda sp. Alg238-R41]